MSLATEGTTEKAHIAPTTTDESILDKIDHSVRKIEDDIHQESYEVKMKSNKIQNLKSTLHNLNRNKNDLLNQHNTKIKKTALQQRETEAPST